MKSRSRKDDAATRILRAKGNPAELDRILQDECRRRASRKLAATLSSAPGFRFPTSLSAEQCTADNVAEFHASLIEPGSSVVDLTCGLGIDSFHMARRCLRVVCMDIDSDVSAAIGHNARELGLENISAVCGDCREWLEGYAGEPFDVAFIDPARRADDGSRLYSLTQCKPDVVEMIPLIAAHARRLIIKASPMLDVTTSLAELSEGAAVYAVGTKA
ncbi:MAG: methyltransferase domain-containing protein, partial [Muribaculaceae bacterium]|nr:methyltransferase domain-containing protein [Muribaculaceae bacterium]